MISMSMINMSMMTLSLLGVASAMLVCALVGKLFAGEPKASKSERAQIIERLLALSEHDKKSSATASKRLPLPQPSASKVERRPQGGNVSVRLRAPITAKGAQLGYSPAIRTNK